MEDQNLKQLYTRLHDFNNHVTPLKGYLDRAISQGSLDPVTHQSLSRKLASIYTRVRISLDIDEAIKALITFIKSLPDAVMETLMNLGYKPNIPCLA